MTKKDIKNKQQNPFDPFFKCFDQVTEQLVHRDTSDDSKKTSSDEVKSPKATPVTDTIQKTPVR